MALIGYARVSSVGQNLDVQRDKLAHCDKIFEEKHSGSTNARPRLKACLEYIREGDVLVVTRLDRLARSTLHLCQIAVTLKVKRGRPSSSRPKHQYRRCYGPSALQHARSHWAVRKGNSRRAAHGRDQKGYAVCLGCSACISVCEKEAISLVLREDYRIPPKNKGWMFARILWEKRRLVPFVVSRIKRKLGAFIP